MNKMLVAVFENDTAAYEGLRALQDLHRDGEITLYATAVLSKNEHDELLLKIAADRGPVGPATGMIAGSLIGLIGGPIGLGAGIASGYVGVVPFDFESEESNTRFAAEVSNALVTGKTVIIAEIDEGWTFPVDTRLANATVSRRLRKGALEAQLARESKAIATDYQKLKEELIHAGEVSKAKIRIAIAKLEAKTQAVNEQVIENVKKAQANWRQGSTQSKPR